MNSAAALRYAQFRADVFGGIAEPPACPWDHEFSELDIQSLWFAGEFGADFATVDGEKVRIRDFGCWNSAAGPDFTGCAIELGGKTLRGDIEIDPDIRDWERHRHGANPDYDHVVLHVFLEAPEGSRFYTRTAGHREVAQVRLTREMLADGAQPVRGLAAARLGRCATPLREMEEKQVASMIEAAARHRLERKAARLRQWIASQGREQAIFQALAQALGYRRNQKPFVILAQRLPLRSLLKLDAMEREALLFGVSGFLDEVRYEDTTADTRAYLRGLWSRWWKARDTCLRWLEPQSRLKWTLAGARPGNHPQRRLGALAAMLEAWPRIAGPLKRPEAWKPRVWRDAVLALEHSYWSTHYTLMAEPSPKPLALVGGTRLQELLANVVYPLLSSERADLWREYCELPAALDNQKIRRAALRLFGDNPRAKEFQKKLHQQQGLLQVYEDFCLEDDSSCADCPFPERLRQWR